LEELVVWAEVENEDGFTMAELVVVVVE